MRVIVVMAALLAALGQAVACENVIVCSGDQPSAAMRRQMEVDRNAREFDRDYNNFLADNRARETNRRLEAIQREIEATRDELRWQQRLDSTFDRPRY